ncbi:hypothetical protein Anapl_02021 [Anas platyrhynchos]|uniref:Uncharacterized protein n=1 Tax=Anas platyrhynchos TaxID=8839 RepID=R0M494_ANAPL|nr:hypothetical protein Anapl_02021 [Anas platyrhynchos]
MDIPLSLLPSSRSPGGPERILWERQPGGNAADLQQQVSTHWLEALSTIL